MANRPQTENFREHLANVNTKGKRIWIYPKIIKGQLYKYRSWFSYLLLIFLFAGPFIRINGKPLLLLNFVGRKFVIFGTPFWPQDFFILAIAVVTFILFIVLFTVIFGRVWCGWACPQTIFMEMVFRKIENWIEGNANKQKKLDAMPWNWEKIWKKTAKHTIFFLISFAIANTFLAYLIGSDALIKIITEPVSEHVVGLASILIFSFVFYLVFAKLRELVCIMICPYGRLQGVMLDRNSIVVAYDTGRGEPRGKIRKNEDQSEVGDCIDCGLCVDVCPTGIDIRNGTQLECVNCTACIDACDSVMDKINRPRGLIRFDSVENIEKGVGFRWTNRIKAYTAVLFVLIVAFVTILITRPDFEAVVLRNAGTTPVVDQGGFVSNSYQIELVNKTFEDVHYNVRILNNDSAQLIIPNNDGILPGGTVQKKVMMIRIPHSTIHSNRTKLKIAIERPDQDETETYETIFLSPLKIKQ